MFPCLFLKWPLDVSLFVVIITNIFHVRKSLYVGKFSLQSLFLLPILLLLLHFLFFLLHLLFLFLFLLLLSHLLLLLLYNYVFNDNHKIDPTFLFL